MALPPAPTDEMLRRALTALRGGAAAEGEHLLRQVLAADPSQPDALQLLGLSARTAGRLSEAIDLFRRSLAGRDGQPAAIHAVRLKGRSHAAKAQLFIAHLKTAFGSPSYWDIAVTEAL